MVLQSKQINQSTLLFLYVFFRIRSESVVDVDGAFISDSNLNFGPFSPFLCLYSLRCFPLLFRQYVERWVQLLTSVLVGVHSKFVVVCGRVFPLSVRLHIQDLHEGANFYLGVVLS